MESLTSRPDLPSPASVALMEAVDQAIEGESVYPDRATFVDADGPDVGRQIAQAHSDDRAVVLCSADGTRLAVTAAPPAATA